jgi:hypothetical protein
MLTFKEFITEAPAGDHAHQLGLSHMGYGRYGRDGKVSHVSRNDKLTHVSKVKDFSTLHGGQLKHLEHADDEVFNHGSHGVRNIVDHVNALRHGDDRVKVSQKIDGCVHEDTIIMTNMGEIKIKDVTTQTTVMGHDFGDGLDKMIDIINKTQSPSNKQWVEVFFENEQSVKVTEDHEIFTTNRGWVEAGQLTEADNVQTM